MVDKTSVHPWESVFMLARLCGERERNFTNLCQIGESGWADRAMTMIAHGVHISEVIEYLKRSYLSMDTYATVGEDMRKEVERRAELAMLGQHWTQVN